MCCFGSQFDKLGEEVGRCTVGCASATPGIVARLMGLESLPRRHQTRLGSPKMGRFSDYREFEDDKFIFLSFEHGPVRIRGRGRSRGIEKENEEMEVGSKKNSGSGSNARKNPRNLQRSPLSRNSLRKPRKQREKNLKYDGDDESENSSPNSVLNCEPEEFSNSTNCKSQRTNPDDLKNLGYTFPDYRKLAGAGEKIISASARKTNRGLYSAWKRTGERRELSVRESVESFSNQHRRHAEEIGKQVAAEIYSFLLEEMITFL